ncbi:MAG: fatty-acid oxidation protein subunit alpha [Okeania sp. SIO3I5]|uniref:XisH family protein n=1 Tax=Okeania sp. SIO3I5 TaxID=2607805 RepID=UPI0013B8DD44|nr:XisH family protein [Okeania sp. SIO3I5]NEQ38972.1 fatty-acid oxidation protein subunit alpha [Okeania sp. SIO3I5]
MPTKDVFHDAVKNALIKENWTITDDPLFLEFGGVDMYVDLGAEKLVAAEKDGKKIAVEIKSFIQKSITYEFHTALGQYLNYRFILNQKDPERILFLAVPEDSYKTFFRLLFTQGIIAEQRLKIIIYNVNQEVIIEWKN